jgi:hypothetical protein
MANDPKKNVSKGLSVILIVAGVGFLLLLIDHWMPMPAEIRVAAIAALSGALYAGVDALKHSGDDA